MSKRFTDTEKWKKNFMRTLPPEYKLLWFYILDDCDHAGIWHVDFEIAELRVGKGITKEQAFVHFKEKLIEFDDGEKWFIPSFVEFQYGELKDNNRAHISVINQLSKYDLIDKMKYKYAHKLNGSITPKKKQQILVRDNFTCTYCGIEFDPHFLQPDHVVPTSKGVDNDYSNLVTTCSKCNRDKWDMLLEDYVEKFGLDLKEIKKRIKGATEAPIQGAKKGAKDKDKDMDKDMVKDKEKDIFHDHLFEKLKIRTKQKDEVKFLFKHYTLDQLKGAIDTASLYHSKHSPKRGFKWGKNWTKFFENIDTFMDDDMYKARIEQELRWTNNEKHKMPSNLIDVSKSTHTIKQFINAGRFKGHYDNYDNESVDRVAHEYNNGKTFRVPEDKI